MAKSFVFRDGKGRLCGYLLHREGELSCRIDAAICDARLSVVAQTGQVRTYTLTQGKTESIINDSPVEIEGAYVWDDDALVMDTGEIARQKYADMIAEREKRDTRSRLKMKTSEPEKDGGEAYRDEKQEETHCARNPQEIHPQRRWPPPVLLDKAVYQAGRWTERT